MASATTPPTNGSLPSKQVTPLEDDSLQKRMSVDKNVVDELLLVCGVIGTTVEREEGIERIVPVTDCLNWLQDLQRALRRDDDLYRPISLLVGQWKVVQQKLLPLVLSCRYDTAMVLTICKILVILTKPLSENSVRAARTVIDTKKFPERVIKEQIRLRENAIKQADTLMEYKRAICHHPSHVGPKKEGEEGGILSVFVSLLAEPLSRTGTARTDLDHLTIELVLHLFRNLLSAEPLLHSSSMSASRAQELHHELICLLERELVLEILLVLGADLEQRENLHYDLLLMELLQHLLRHHDPASVARSSLSKAEMQSRSASVSDGSGKKGFLSQQLAREKQNLVAKSTSRHSYFGGTLVTSKPGGKTAYMSTTQLAARTGPVSQATRRRNKKAEPFIAKSKASTIGGGPAKQRAEKTLDTFCIRFVSECYGTVMKCLKNEFRRDSVRLEDGDRVVFFRIVWFFCHWWRAGGSARVLSTNQTAGQANGSLGQLIFSMDVFSFNLVLNAVDTFIVHKKYSRLAQAVALLSEMMHLLYTMFSSEDSTEQLMALGLMDRLFYGSEPLDRLPKLMSNWSPGSSTRDYLGDLAEVCYMTLKLLDANAKKLDSFSDRDKAKHDTIAKMKANAVDFDVQAYFCRKLVSNHTVFMYTQLLSQYADNSSTVNHRIVAFFLRLCKVQIASADDTTNDPDLPQNLLASKNVTLEPMLYNIQMLTVLETILNDAKIQKDKDYGIVVSFATGIIHNFSKAASDNPLVFVEAFFRHGIPHKHCELMMNKYVTEELRMIAQRELLLEQQEIFEREAAALEEEDDAEEEDEVEFEDFGIQGEKLASLSAKQGNDKKTESDQSSDERTQASKEDIVENDKENQNVDEPSKENSAFEKHDEEESRKRDMPENDVSDDEDIFTEPQEHQKRARLVFSDDDEEEEE